MRQPGPTFLVALDAQGQVSLLRVDVTLIDVGRLHEVGVGVDDSRHGQILLLGVASRAVGRPPRSTFRVREPAEARLGRISQRRTRVRDSRDGAAQELAPHRLNPPPNATFAWFAPDIF
jgi:hypothetical protein